MKRYWDKVLDGWVYEDEGTKDEDKGEVLEQVSARDPLEEENLLLMICGVR